MPEHVEDINLRSEEVKEILTRVPHWMIRYGNVLFLILILLILFLSWLIKYPDIIAAEAVVTTEIPPQKIYAKANRNIDSIFIDQSQEVFPDQTLAVLDNSAIYEDVILLKKTLDTLKFTEEDFYFPVNEMPILLLGNIEASYAAFENDYITYALNRDLQPYENDKTAVNLTQQELEGRLKNLTNQITFKKSELQYEKKKLQRNQNLFEKGVISAQDVEQSEMEYLSNQRDLQNLTSSLYQIKQSIAENQKNSRGIYISKTSDDRTLKRKLIQSYNQLRKNIRDWEFEYVLKSEIRGEAYFFNHWSKNQSVEQGEMMFTIIPLKESSYIAKLKTPVQNSGKIQIGQKVLVKLQNYPDTEFGTLQGQVENISKVPFKENEINTYLVNVSLPDSLITSYNKKIEFKGEMLGTGEIITKDVRLINRFFYQLKELMDR